MYINNALLLHGHSAFSLSILEIINISDLSKKEARKLILEREQYYLDLFFKKQIPLYNILKVAGSMLGHNHSSEFRAKMSEAQKGKVMSPEIKIKISATKGTSIYVYSEDYKLENIFSSAREGAKFFNCNKDTIFRYAKMINYLKKNGSYLYRLRNKN